MTRSISYLHLFAIVVFSAALGAAAAGAVMAQNAGSESEIMVGRLESPVDPIATRILNGWLADAESAGVQLFILELDTPGGSIDSTRDMVGAILDSPVPVAVYVAPSGARAASAGTFLVAAGHIAAMAPGTNIGAASPVSMGGDDLPETLKSKATEDAAALLRGIASQRGRNSDALEKTIFEAASYSVEEALELDVIDVSAPNLADLLEQIDGRAVTVSGVERTLSTDGALIRQVEPTRVQLFLQWIADPQIAFILLAAGGILVLVEMLSPGGWVPGVTGAGLLILAFLALGSLPVNWVGLVLIVAGLILFFIELQAAGWGGFGAAGAVSFILGGFLLFGDTSVPGLPAPDVRVGLGVLLGTAGVMAASLFSLWFFVRKSRDLRSATRDDEIIGQIGIVRTTLDPKGTVQVASELWSGEAGNSDTIEEGESVVVAEIDGVMLIVFRATSLEATERSFL